jgi:ElaB/YqjD/DUF883 family membrane-anchored ribosome-binding protein
MSDTDRSHEDHRTNLVQSDLAKVQSDLAKVAAQTRSALDAGLTGLRTADRSWREPARTETSRDFYEAISAAARDNPLLALGISAGMGLLLGRIVSQGLPGNPVSRPKKRPRLPW